MDGDDHLRHRGHADHVGADGAQEAILGARLQVRPRHRDEDALVAGDLLLQGQALGQGDQLAIVGPAHVGEARTEAVVVPADERVVAEEVDVVLDDHDVALAELRVHAAAGVADDQHFTAQGLHDADRKGDLLERVALVEVEPALPWPRRSCPRACRRRAGRHATRPWTQGNAGSSRRARWPRRRSHAARPPSPVPRMMPIRGLPDQRLDGLRGFLNLIVELEHA